MKKKIYPRISTQLPAIVTTVEGVKIKVIALDISQHGFSFQCSTYQRNLLTPGGCFIHNGRPVELEVNIELPFPDQSMPIKVRCQVSFSRRIANEKCELGIRYEEFEGEGYNDLIGFIETTSINASTQSPPAKPPVTNPLPAFI
jgi:hypothetical protein